MKILKQNGVDTARFGTALQSAKGQRIAQYGLELASGRTSLQNRALVPESRSGLLRSALTYLRARHGAEASNSQPNPIFRRPLARQAYGSFAQAPLQLQATVVQLLL